MSTGLLAPLRHGRFARFYGAQAASQLGDAITWVALAILAVHLEGAERAPLVISVALTLRVAAYVALGPVAGVVADRLDRRLLLVTCHLGRLAALALLAWASTTWHLYVLLLVANAFTAFFTPANQATVPLVVDRRDLRGAFALSAATTEVFGIVGPGLAGIVAVGLGFRSLFVGVAVLYGLAALLVATLGPLRATHADAPAAHWADVRDGTARVWGDAPIRFALLAELVAALAGALVLTVTVARVEAGLGLSDAHFGWVMAAYGVGATVASVAVAHLGRVSLVRWIALGAALTAVAVVPADAAPYGVLVGLWALAGVGQNWVNLPAETLIAERTEQAAQGRVYGAHFAWSHLWWVLAYPLAGWLAQVAPHHVFALGGGLAVAVFAVVALAHRRDLAGGRPPRRGSTAAEPGGPSLPA